MDRKPVIAITIGVPLSAWSAHDDRGRYIPYAESVVAAGGVPLMVGIEQAPAILADPVAFLRRFDGLLLTGGADVHLALYPNPPSFPGKTWDEVMAQHSMRVDEGRDEMDLALARAAYDAGCPTLGVCRGHQVLNVALGGRLVLHLDPTLGHSTNADRSSSLHRVRVERGTRLSRILNEPGELPVNSRHHQAADPAHVAPPLRATAWTPDGAVIEALEAPGHPWLVGVQWHPERHQDAESHEGSRPLFAAFVAACRNGKNG